MDQRNRNAAVVPAVGSASSVCCLRSLGRRGVYTIAASEKKSPPAFSSKYCDETARLPSFHDDVVAYKDGLLSLAKREDVRAIATLREIDVYVLAKYRHQFADHVEPVWPSMEALRTAHDRVRLVRAARAAGVGVPETRLLSEVDDWSREQIVKDRYAVLTGDYVDSYAEDQYGLPGGTTYLEPGVEPDCERLRAEMGHEPIVQEYVPGEEYSVWALYDDGDPVATCHKRQVRRCQYEGGTSVCRETVEIPALETAGRDLLDHLDWHGPAAVQFVRNEETGEFQLLDVNPRFWMSLSCAIRAGLDFPYYHWMIANGESIRVGEYEVGVATHLARGELGHLRNVLRADNPDVEPPSVGARALEIARSCYDQPNFDYLTLDDPLPFVRDALNTAAEIVVGASGDSDGRSAPVESGESSVSNPRTAESDEPSTSNRRPAESVELTT